MKQFHASRPARRAGFSLAELMVVIVIIGLLATLVVPNVVSALFKGQRGTMKANISQMVSAVDSYYIDHSRYPQSLEELVTPDENNLTYLKATTVPLDPWKNPYQYEPASGGQPYRIFSLGRDGQQGGEGEDADYDNTMLND